MRNSEKKGKNKKVKSEKVVPSATLQRRFICDIFCNCRMNRFVRRGVYFRRSSRSPQHLERGEKMVTQTEGKLGEKNRRVAKKVVPRRFLEVRSSVVANSPKF